MVQIDKESMSLVRHRVSGDSPPRNDDDEEEAGGGSMMSSGSDSKLPRSKQSPSYIASIVVVAVLIVVAFVSLSGGGTGTFLLVCRLRCVKVLQMNENDLH